MDDFAKAKRDSLHAVADEIANLQPVEATLKHATPFGAAKNALRMVVDLIRERADDRPNTGRKHDDKCAIFIDGYCDCAPTYFHAVLTPKQVVPTYIDEIA